MTKRTKKPATRRNFVKTIGSGLSLVGLSNVAGASEDTVEIVTLIANGDPIEKRTVPRSWHQHFQNARRATRRLGSSELEKNGVKSVSLGRGSKKFGGQRGFRIRLEVDSENYRGTPPRKKDKIPIETIEPRETGPSCYSDNQFSSVPGGAKIEYGSTYGTTNAVVKDPSNNTRLLTCAHIFDGCTRSDEGVGLSVDQAGQSLGEVVWTEPSEDIALVEITNNNLTYDNRIREETDIYAHYEPVYAHFSDGGIGMLISDNDTIRQAGVTTGISDGKMLEMDLNEADSSNDPDVDCVTWGGPGTQEGFGIETSANNAQGNSGGPIYQMLERNGEMVVGLAGMIQQWAGFNRNVSGCGGSTLIEGKNTLGAAWYRIEDEYDIDPLVT
ncbi:trypsin-like peptidase domain-containing protein [Salinigranum rubrum]|uniref:trypsin-like peptidase domain-containing protein n=1 Tax=Salinigranum rubrum TaxID=755307 RepID=UPI0013A59CA1|nr:trypsin-like peptidase domain-containing protein [Salinigranum rubrum]